MRARLDRTKGGDIKMNNLVQKLLHDNPEIAEDIYRSIEGSKLRLDPDDYEIFQAILQMGLSAWGAAQKVFSEGISNRDLSSIYRRARVLEEDILKHFNISIKKMASELLEGKRIECPDELDVPFQKFLLSRGIKAKRVIVYELVQN